jgi:hypothetical protein
MVLTYRILRIQMPYNSHVNIFISQNVQDADWHIQVYFIYFTVFGSVDSVGIICYDLRIGGYRYTVKPLSMVPGSVVQYLWSLSESYLNYGSRICCFPGSIVSFSDLRRKRWIKVSLYIILLVHYESKKLL